MTEHKAFQSVEIKDADKGQVEAVFSTFNEVDSDGDVTRPGAFEDGQEVRISAYGHTSWGGKLPVGKGTIKTTGQHAVLKGQFFMDVTEARETFKVIKEMGSLQEWSYGFDVLERSEGTWPEDESDGEPVQFLNRVKVHEVSPVLIGAGVDTRTLAVKDETKQPPNLRAVEDDDEGERCATCANFNDGTCDRYDVDVRTNQVCDSWESAGASERRSRTSEMKKGPIGAHSTATTGGTWDGAAAVRNAPEEAAALRAIHAWIDPNGDADAKGSYKFPHHATPGGPANLTACSAIIAALNGGRGGAAIPDGDRRGVYNHAARHLRDGDREPPELRDRPDGEMKLADHLWEVVGDVLTVIDRAEAVSSHYVDSGRTMGGRSPKAAVELIEAVDRLHSLSTHTADRHQDEEQNVSLLAELMRLNDTLSTSADRAVEIVKQIEAARSEDGEDLKEPVPSVMEVAGVLKDSLVRLRGAVASAAPSEEVGRVDLAEIDQNLARLEDQITTEGGS